MKAIKQRRIELFAAYLQGIEKANIFSLKWNDYEPVGKYRIKKEFLTLYNSMWKP